MFEKLLNHIIAEHIRHQLNGVRVYFPEDLVFLIAVCRLQFLLNESGPVLVTTEFNYMVVYILKLLSKCLHMSGTQCLP